MDKKSLDERCNQILRNMEASLTARDRVGIQDFVLLDPYTSETAFLENLKKRFHENLIYTYIGTLLVSVNPYKDFDIYSKKQMDIYMGVNFFELPPHIYALADNVFRTMLSEFNNHFILISGEISLSSHRVLGPQVSESAPPCPLSLRSLSPLHSTCINSPYATLCNNSIIHASAGRRWECYFWRQSQV
ncbi:hypothetical protein JOQ06_008664 [Pogonophryne albipinna]|uniref:Myosin motor domain-containing protein n=1 Tax=Pogonophryne albipinna TaxID=1090488 RepID=A0AAD6AKJ1_9TELE|nr:hypothetical protein JOQ06_008664 [Pogonophryne albipinna]